MKGRVLLSLLFIIAGAFKVIGFAGATAYTASFGLPYPAIVTGVVAAVELIGGIMLLVGFHARIAAVLLGVFVFATIIVAHRDLADQTQLTAALKNLAIIGGLAYVWRFGSGPWSLSSGSGCACCEDTCTCDCDGCDDCGKVPAAPEAVR